MPLFCSSHLAASLSVLVPANMEPSNLKTACLPKNREKTGYDVLGSANANGLLHRLLAARFVRGSAHH